MQASRRQSARSPHVALATLSELLTASKRVLFVTGAGTSVASGIPSFRGDHPGSIWSQRTLRYGKLSTFTSDPLQWYNSFWLAGVIPWHAFYNAEPNAAHHALAELARTFPKVSIVSQNIDTLHRSAGTPQAQLLLAHGNVEFFRCDKASRYGERVCDVGEVEINLHDYAAAKDARQASAVPPEKLRIVPKCSVCGGSMRPACLMFDEDYDERVWTVYEKWANEADAFVFVGSSNAVGLTADAFKVAARRNVPTYNFNLNRKCMEYARGAVYHITGRAEETLPQLVRMVKSIAQ